MVALLMTGCMAGFFYAFSITVMWGLDAGDHFVAIAAMRDINGAVRNFPFFVTFFLTGPVILTGAWLAFKGGGRQIAGWLGTAAVAYIIGVNLVTFTVNVPLNDGLAALVLPLSPEAAHQVWLDYSGVWTDWNHVRTLANSLSLLLLGWSLFLWGRHHKSLSQ
ncbi:anthrone oxygenase family protein [Rhodovibrionaceae bacterium A322]